MTRAALTAAVASALIFGGIGCQSGQKDASAAKAPEPAPRPEPVQPRSAGESGADRAHNGWSEPKERATASRNDGGGSRQPGDGSSDDTYTVEKGDTLWSIAERVYGNGKRWRDIAEANGIEEPSADLKKGQVLVLP